MKCSVEAAVFEKIGLHLESDFALMGKLHRVADEVEDDLTQPARVAGDERRVRPARFRRAAPSPFHPREEQRF